MELVFAVTQNVKNPRAAFRATRRQMSNEMVLYKHLENHEVSDKNSGHQTCSSCIFLQNWFYVKMAKTSPACKNMNTTPPIFST